MTPALALCVTRHAAQAITLQWNNIHTQALAKTGNDAARAWRMTTRYFELFGWAQEDLE